MNPSKLYWQRFVFWVTSGAMAVDFSMEEKKRNDGMKW
jgi:hypothetical protein